MTVGNRELAGAAVPPIGLGCMVLSHAYGNPPPPEVGEKVLRRALEIGYVHFDTAALYGFGRNEILLGPVLGPHRDEIFLASKCGMTGVDGVRTVDGRPETIRATCEQALERLRTDVIDLYYLHRIDPRIPLADTVGAMTDLIEEGKIKAIGLSEVSAGTLRKVHALQPVAAVQSEYSLWSRNAEVAVLEACAEIGAAYVAFAPLARGFLADMALDPTTFAEKDIRRNMPRFNEPNFSRNRERLLPGYRRIADEVGCTPGQLSLAWLLHRAPHIHVIPGTTNPAHLEENFGALGVEIGDDVAAELDRLINLETVSGPRYPAAAQKDIDTELLPGEPLA
jgi:aryl-alcohol dehydrogenase-like predicted oxidoreductase